MSDTSNTHAELANGTAYNYKVCCSDSALSISNETSGSYFVVLRLSGFTNAHVEMGNESNYDYPVFINVPSGGSMHCAYASSCAGYDTCLASISGNTNAHVADCTTDPYTTKICCFMNKPSSVTQPTITPDPAYTTNDLNCSVTPTDNETTSLNVTFRWWKNGALQSAYITTVEGVTNNTQVYTNLTVPSSAVNKHDNWTCEAFAYDDDLYSSYHNSSIQISNTVPTTPTSLTPTTGTYGGTYHVVSVSCSGSSDDDTDTIYYNIEAYYDSAWHLLSGNDADGNYDWNVSSLTTQTGVDLRCSASDIESNSSNYNPAGTLTIDNTAPATSNEKITSLIIGDILYVNATVTDTPAGVGNISANCSGIWSGEISMSESCGTNCYQGSVSSSGWSPGDIGCTVIANDTVNNIQTGATVTSVAINDPTLGSSEQVTTLSFTDTATQDVVFRKLVTIDNTAGSKEWSYRNYAPSALPASADKWWIIEGDDSDCSITNCDGSTFIACEGSGDGNAPHWTADQGAGTSGYETLCYRYDSGVTFSRGDWALNNTGTEDRQDYNSSLTITETVDEATTFSYDITGTIVGETCYSGCTGSNLDADGWAGTTAFAYGDWINELVMSSYSQNNTGTRNEARIDFNASASWTASSNLPAETNFTYDLGTVDVGGTCVGDTWITSQTGTITAITAGNTKAIGIQAYADCIVDIDCSSSNWTIYYCNATLGPQVRELEEIRCTISNIINNWTDDLYVNLVVTEPRNFFSDNWGSCYDCTPTTLISADDTTDYTFSEKANVVNLTEEGWILNGTCSQYVDHRLYRNQTVTIENFGGIALTSCYWEVPLPGTNTSVVTLGTLDVPITGTTTMAQIYDACNIDPGLTNIVVSPSCVDYGTTVTVTSSGASDTENDNLVLQVGSSSNVWDKCNSSSGKGERSCSFSSTWEDTGIHTLYAVVNDSTTVSTEIALDITVDNIGPNMPSSLSPENTSKINETMPNLIWSTTDIGCNGSVIEYNISISENSDCSNPLQNVLVAESNYTTSYLKSANRYYWRVKAKDGFDNWGNWSNCSILDIYENIKIVTRQPTADEIIYRGDNKTLYTITRNSTDAAIPATVIWYNSTTILATGKNTSWTVPINYRLGPETIYINASNIYYWTNSTSINVLIYGWSKTEISSETFAYVGERVKITCNVTDANTSEVIPNYPVQFYNGSTLIGRNDTNSNGVVTYTWDTAGAVTGNQTLKCVIDDFSQLYYSAGIAEAASAMYANRTANVTIARGNGTTTGIEGYEKVNLTVNLFDVGLNATVKGSPGKIWVEKSDGVWDGGWDCTSDDNGNCTVQFNPDCSYSEGWRRFVGGIVNSNYYNDTNSSIYGWVYLDMLPYCSKEITFVLDLNISGTQYDEAEVGGLGTGIYHPEDVNDYYICLYDSDLGISYGLVFSGKDLYYMNLSSSDKGYSLGITQYEGENRFIIPVVSGPCSIIRDKMSQIREFGYPVRAFIPVTREENPIEVILEYLDIDIIGNETESGSFGILLEKNETAEQSQIIAEKK